MDDIRETEEAETAREKERERLNERIATACLGWQTINHQEICNNIVVVNKFRHAVVHIIVTWRQYRGNCNALYFKVL
jgi:hypothetical protein